MPNQYLPIGISLRSRRCLVVGGGNVALRKIETLLEYGADITVIAPAPHEKIEYYAKRNNLKLEKREYKSGDARPFGLAISASDNNEVNRTVYEECRQAGTPVNVVDNPDLCEFIFPAILRRNCLSIAISTDGKAPFLSGHLRLILESVFPEHWNQVAKYAAIFRDKVMGRWPRSREKKLSAFGKFLDADWKTMIKNLDEEAIIRELDLMLDAVE
jgi:siroheme synthase-like protein